jgi:prevent-host-death family protein
MVMSVTMPAGEFKARCLAVLDEVAESGREVVITKRGRPVARVAPLTDDVPSLIGSVRYASEDDVLAPIDDSWDLDR